MIDVKDALTHKYGPLPGYAWAMLGAGAIVLVASRKKSSAGSSSPAFLTTPPQGAVGDGLGAGGGGSDTVDPAVSFGLPNVVDPNAAGAFATPTSAADYFAANPLPAGSSTQDALDALGAFPAQSYDFGPSPYVDYGSIPTTAAGWAALTGATSPQNAAEPIAYALTPPANVNTNINPYINPYATPTSGGGDTNPGATDVAPYVPGGTITGHGFVGD